MNCPALGEVQSLIRRLEQDYAFECEAGPLRLCVDWQRLRQLITAPAVRTSEPWTVERHLKYLHD
jgi:hypothetical protein